MMQPATSNQQPATSVYFCDNLRNIRRHLGLTNSGMARLIGIEEHVFLSYTNKACMPKIDVMLQICRTFDCTIDQFLTTNIKLS